MSVASIRATALDYLANARLSNITDSNGKSWLSIDGHLPSIIRAYDPSRSRFEIRLTRRSNQAFYEEVTTLLLSHLLTEFAPRTVFDIGAAGGYFAFVAASHIGAHPSVHCFEMKPHQVRLIEDKAKSAGLAQTVSAHLAGLSDRHVGRKRIWFVRNMMFESEPSPEAYREAWYIRLKFALRGGGGAYRTLQPADVLLTSLDHFCATNDLSPDLIKIDVDGYEGKVLAGAQAVLRESQPIVLLELHTNDMLRDGSTRRSVAAQLSDAGYRFLMITDHHRREACDLVAFDASNPVLDRNEVDMILCVPPRLA